MTNQQELTPCDDVVQLLFQNSMLSLLGAANTLERLASKGYTITRAEPTVPQSDVETDIGTIECFARCHGGEFERDLLASTNRIRAHIAELEADNKRLRKSLGFVAARSNLGPHDDTAGAMRKLAIAALAQTERKAG